MSLKIISRKKQKVKREFSKRLKTPYEAAPQGDFWAFKDYVRTEIDKKETARVIKEHVKKHFPKDEAALMLTCPEWCFMAPYHVGATIVWTGWDKPLPVEWNGQVLLAKYFRELKVRAERRLAATESDSDDDEVHEPAPRKKTPAEIVDEKTSAFICDVEGVLDEFYDGSVIDIENYSPYMELKKIDAPYIVAKRALDYYVPLFQEIQELVKKKTRDLVEGYRHLSVKKKNEYLALVTVIVEDLRRYIDGKKAVRKTRIAKPVTADRQTKHVRYLPESSEFKLTSISPARIVGAVRLFLFNVKYRCVVELVADRVTGLEVRGSTVQNVDFEKSRGVKLRKPEQFLPTVISSTVAKIDAEWKKLTTKTFTPNARLNEATLILRAVDS